MHFSKSREGFKEEVSAIQAFKGECQKERAKYPSVPGSGPIRSKGRERDVMGVPGVGGSEGYSGEPGSVQAVDAG